MQFNFYQYKMTQYNSLNVKLSSSQPNKLKSAIKNETEAVLKVSSNMIGNSGDATNFSHKLLLANRQVANLTNQQLMLRYQKLNYLRWHNQEDLLVDFLVYY